MFRAEWSNSDELIVCWFKRFLFSIHSSTMMKMIRAIFPALIWLFLNQTLAFIHCQIEQIVRNSWRVRRSVRSTIRIERMNSHVRYPEPLLVLWWRWIRCEPRMISIASILMTITVLSTMTSPFDTRLLFQLPLKRQKLLLVWKYVKNRWMIYKPMWEKPMKLMVRYRNVR